jgi:manganese/zinc/iron transport system substrate-binding protein
MTPVGQIMTHPSARSSVEPRESSPRAARRGVLTLVLFVLSVPMASCGGPPTPEGDEVRVVATIGMIADVTARVGGERVVVTGLMGPGVDPHLYKASAGDVRTLASADLILFNGLHLEAAMAEVLREMDGRIRTRAVTDGIPRDRLLTPTEFAGQYDPHVWFDVELWMLAVEAVAESLVEVDPEGEAVYRQNLRGLLEELEELDAWVHGRVEEIPVDLRVLVTAHDAFNYFGRAYGFEVQGLQGLSTVAEAGTGDVQRVTALIAERGIPAIFVESSIPRRNVEAVQAAVRARGGRVEIGGMLFSDAMGDAGTEEGTYPGMVRHNVNTIVDGLLGGIYPDGEG